MKTPFWLIGLLGMIVPASMAFGQAQDRGEADSSIHALAQGKGEPAEATIIAGGWNRMTRSIVIHARGVGFYNDSTQFTLPPEEIAGLFKLLDEKKFAGMPSGFGGPAVPATGYRPAPILTGWVTVKTAEGQKTVTQAEEGAQSPELAAIGRAILDVSAKAARRGVTTRDLREGIRKLAAGELTPEALSLTCLQGHGDRPISAPPESPPPQGFFVRVDGRSVTSYLDSQTVRWNCRKLTLSDADCTALIKVLAENDAGSFDTLQDALYAPHQTRLVLKVLGREYVCDTSNHEENPKWDPKVLDDAQRRFERVFNALYTLHLRVMK